jgi:hypothetical protein
VKIRALSAALLLALCSAPAGAAPRLTGDDGSLARIDRRAGDAPMRIAGYRLPASVDPETLLREQRQLADWLASEMVPQALASPVRLGLTKEELLSLESPDPTERRLRVGLARPLGAALDLSSLDPALLSPDRPLPLGAVRGTDDGGYTWSAVVQSPGASALRFRFTDFRLPAQAAAWVFDLEGHAHGPYTGRGPQGDGDFWSHNVFSDVVVVQVRHSGPVTAEQLAATRLTIAEVGHSGPLFRVALAPAVNDARGGVAHYQYVSGAFLYICSGGLLADTDDTTDEPWFLTANHCVSRGRDASNVETWFNWDTPCGGSCATPAQSSTLGASLERTNKTGDYSLLRLDQTPSGVTFLGSSSAPVADANGTPLYRISHPAGAPQAYSAQEVDTSRTTCRSWPRGPWIYSTDTVGATEGGSSGSPVVNAAGEVVGQLSGACGYNVGDPCDSASNATVDGAFASYYSEIADLLDPSSGPGCTPTSSTEVACSDGVDDDCDGATDCDDSDCDQDAACAGPPSPCNGDGVCDPGEDCTTCPNECAGVQNGKPSGRWCCGNGVLEPGEGDGSVCDGNP